MHYRFDALTFPTFAVAEVARRAATRAACRTGTGYPGAIVEVDDKGTVHELTEYGLRVSFQRWNVFHATVSR